jgi:hypothetical protein
MTNTEFQPARLDGPLGRRIRERRAWLDELPWSEALPTDSLELRWTWTQTAFSEYAAAASFAETTAALLGAGAPLDLVAVTSDFVVDEVVHVEAAARVAVALGGAVPLDVDLTRLVRPAVSRDAKLRAAELIVRTSCVGEALSVGVLRRSRELCGSALIGLVLKRVLADEVGHADLGGWFLDWADSWLDDAARAQLGQVAGKALLAFVPLLERQCRSSGFGALCCDDYDAAFTQALDRRVLEPLSARGIFVPQANLDALLGAHPA